ncbi:MAG: ankyrin repeat domain-containing protein [Fidelibacterota bacterium]|nr:MAG: ankyrin repeat domain-containing protein [Candidatus Neomarinimicrobiota bacterium]
MYATRKDNYKLRLNLLEHIVRYPLFRSKGRQHCFLLITSVILILAGCSPRLQDPELKERGQPSKSPGESLHVAALQGNIETIRQHIEAGSDLNEKDAWGSTPLIAAATFGKTEVAVALIEAGADMEITNNEGSTPLHVAAFFCRTEIVKALLDKGADKNAKNNFGRTALEIVASPFDDDVRNTYDSVGEFLEQLGLKLDYERIKETRPRIAEMLR